MSVITPVSGKPKRFQWYGIDFEIVHRGKSQEALLKRLEEVQTEFGLEKWKALSEQKKAEFNARALVGTVVINHDTFKSSDDREWAFNAPVAADLQDQYENQTHQLLVEDESLREWVYITYNDLSRFEDQKRADVIKKF